MNPAPQPRHRTEKPRPLAVVEHPDGAARWAYGRALERAGFDVLTCGGPEVLPRGRCPLVTSGCCETAEAADVVVTALGMGSRETSDVLLSYTTRLPDTPIVAIETPVSEGVALRGRAPRATVLRRPTAESVVDACWDACTEH
jgi:hypothetical protein